MTNPKNASASTTAIGIIVVLLSAVGLAAQNVVSRVFFVPSELFGRIDFGGFITSAPSNVVMLLAIRMAMMAGMLSVLTPWLYARTFSELKRLPQSPKLFGAAIGSATCIFLGLTCLYTSLSKVSAGIAIAAFFIYPAITVLLSRIFFQQKLRPYQLALMVVIFIGVALTNLNPTDATPSETSLMGLWTGLGAGLFFGLYGIFAELCLQAKNKPLHPIPFSLFTFIGVSTLASLSLLFIPPISVTPTAWPLILGTTLFSASLTLIAYILNNFGIRYIGASLTALISASAPALTALFAWWTLQEALQPQQNLGVLLVTLGVAALSIKANKG
ncbi:MAG: DMT family transporter [Cyanobacteria bacterium J06634_6]